VPLQLGVRVGASMTHLLAWTRAKKSGKKLALVMETNFDLAGKLKLLLASSDDIDTEKQSSGGEEEGEVVDGKDFESILGAVTAYHPADADVIFLDKARRCTGCIRLALRA
jgi:hypothetical protein